jgi:DNA invertase Pin-like site-specific DNA recombinase
MEYSTKLVSNEVDYICVYTRVSTRRQSMDKKHGLCYQKELCKDYIKKFYSGTIEQSYWEDVGSSYKSKLILSEMGKMIKKLKCNTLIIISEVSRLGRNYRMVETLLKNIQQKKSYIISVSENLVYGMTKIQNKEFIHKVIDSEKESDVLSMRIKNTQSYIKRNGGHIGKAPFGYKIVKNSMNIPILKENPEDFKLIDYIVNLSDDCYSYQEITTIMNEKNLIHKNKPWTITKIKEILKKFYPEHMTLNVKQISESKNDIGDNNKFIIENNASTNNKFIDDAFIDNIFENNTSTNNKFTDDLFTDNNSSLTVTINNKNNKRIVCKNQKYNCKKQKISHYTNESIVPNFNSNAINNITNNSVQNIKSGQFNFTDNYICLRSGKLIAPFLPKAETLCSKKNIIVPMGQ